MKRLLCLCLGLLLLIPLSFSQKKDTYKVRTVVIDPGHGGAKPGAKGSMSYEKDITLAVAKKLGKLLQDNYPDVKVIFTRTSDVDISLAERARIANKNKADLFISIHANSHPTATPTGVETFVMGLSQSSANLEVAKKENSDILLEADYKTNSDYQGFNPDAPETYVMLTMFQNAYIDKSLNFAAAIQTQYRQSIKTINRGVKQAELYVLYKTSMPSVLTEIGFISNPKEEKYMLSEEGQATIAICLFKAFMNYKAMEEGSNKPENIVYNIAGAEKKERPSAPKSSEKTPSTPTPTTNTPEVKEEVKTDVIPVDTIIALPDTTQTKEPQPIKRPVPSATLTEKETADTIAKTTQRRNKDDSKTTETPQKAEKMPSAIRTAPDTATTYFSVQFLTRANILKVGDTALDGITDFEIYRRNGKYCYTTGRFKTYGEAKRYCKEVQQNTRFKDAWAMKHTPSDDFVDLENGGKTVSAALPSPATQPSASKKAASSQKTTPQTSNKPKVTYRIQICSSPTLLKKGDQALQGITDFHYSKQGSIYIYSAGDYTRLTDAQKRCREIKSKTSFKDAFVIAIKDGERISIKEAQALTK